MSPDRDMPPDDRSGPPDPDVDAVFAQIVAGWDDEPAAPVPPWPATEDVVDRGAPPAERGPAGTAEKTQPPGTSGPTQPSGPARTSGPPAPGEEAADGTATGGNARSPGSEWSPTARHDRSRPEPPAGPPAPGPRDWEAGAEADEGYVPPEPPPLPRGDVVSRLAWAGVLLGPAFLLLSALLWDGAGPVPLGLAALAFIGGFVTLVARLPARRDDDDDDGAVV